MVFGVEHQAVDMTVDEVSFPLLDRKIVESYFIEIRQMVVAKV